MRERVDIVRDLIEKLTELNHMLSISTEEMEEAKRLKWRVALQAVDEAIGRLEYASYYSPL